MTVVQREITVDQMAPNGISDMGAVKEYIQVLEDLENLDSEIEKAEYLRGCETASERSKRIAMIIIDKLSKDPNSYYHKSFPNEYQWNNGSWHPI